VSPTRHQLRSAAIVVKAVSELSHVIPATAAFEAVVGDATSVWRWLAERGTSALE